ncbi:hypothetical protein [Sinomonas sp. B1-1]|uniref:hypothetical protein n=1 Tax=Sinomonas sp. B1-1 TaxID=3141454 RepID=UPI003D26ABD7
MPPMSRARTGRTARASRPAGRTVMLLAAAVLALAGCRPGLAVPPPGGEGRPGLNASGTQRSFSAQELVTAAAETRTALRLGGSVLDQGQLAAQGERAVPSPLTGAGPASCAALTTPATLTGLDKASAALIVAPSDARAQTTAIGFASHASPDAAAATVTALGALAASCARYDAALGGQRVPVVVRAADPAADAPHAVMVISTAQVPDPTEGSTPQERSIVRAVAAKGTVAVEVLLVDTRPEDAAATVRAYADMALDRLPL